MPPRPPRTRSLDLHGYDLDTAADLAHRFVRESYENGYQSVELIHGSRDITEPPEPGGGRGAIKFELRRMLDRGQFDGYVKREESLVLEGSIRLRLLPNPRARSERWSPLPPPRRR